MAATPIPGRGLGAAVSGRLQQRSDLERALLMAEAEAESTLDSEPEEEPEDVEPPMTEEELLSAFAEEVNSAIRERDEKLKDDELALDYFYGRAPAVAADEQLCKELADIGMSTAVSLDVQSAVYAVLAEMMPAFTGQSPVEFQPMDETDEPQAMVETRAVNHTAQSSGIYMSLQQAVMDAMLRRAGIAKVWWEERASVAYESLDGIPEQMLPQVLSPSGPDETVEVIQQPDEEGKGGRLRRTRTRGKPRIDYVPRNEFLISDEMDEPEPNEARLVGHQKTVSRSELIELGMDREQVEALTEFVEADSTGSAHISTEEVMAVEGYYKIDWDGDGIAETLRIITAGGMEGTDELLHWEPWGEQPFVLGVGYLGIGSWDGISLFDRLRDIQELKTSLLRDAVNTTKRNMRQRIGAVEGDANPDDLFDSMVGGVIRMKTPQGLVPVPETQLPPTVFSLLQYLDEVRKDQGGGAIDQTASAQALGQGGDWSLERLMAATEQLNAMVAKSLVETLVKPIYRKLHALLRAYRTSPMAVPGSAGWDRTMPTQWTPREALTVSMGMSVGERSMRMNALGQVLQHHGMDQQTGMTGVMSDQASTYRARVDMLRLAGLQQPELYYVDPNSPQAQQAQQAAQQAAQQQQQMMQQKEQQTMQFQYSLMTDIEKVKAEAKLQAQQMADQTKAQLQQMELQAKRMESMLQQAEKMFGHRKDLAIAQGEWDQKEAQRDIDTLQAEADRKLKAGEALTRGEIEMLKARRQGAQR